MAEYLYPVCALIAWVTVAYRLASLRKDPTNPALRSVCGALTFLALTCTLAVPAIALALDRAIGVPNAAILGAHVCVVVFSAFVLRLLLFWSQPPERARLRWRRLVPVFGVLLGAMILLFRLAPLEQTTASLAGRYARDPYVALYLAVYLGAAAAGQAGIVRMGARYARIARRRWLRLGLRVTVVGAACGLGFCACKAWYVIGVRIGADPRLAETIAPVFGSACALLEVGGLTLPAWGPRLARAHDAARRYLAYRRLTPLWRELYRATPEIALVPPARYGDWLMIDLSFRLYRRVIEIRDGRLALRPHFDPDVASAARRIGRAAGLTGRDLDAAVEASVLAAAIRAKRRDVRTAAGLPVTAALLDGPGGSDLSEEIRWLVPVASALARSGVVRAALAEPAPATTAAPGILPRPASAR